MTLKQTIAVFLLGCLPSIAWADSAEEILRATGVRGGLVLHVGCGDGNLTAAFAGGEGFLVQGLDVDPENVAAARRHVRSLGIYGQVAVDTLLGERLPLMDNLANLVVSEDLGEISMGEVMRVLRPGGVAYVKAAGEWTRSVKPRPAEIDEWTHFLHGPDNNPVGRDQVVDVPRRMQWLGSPKFARAHEQAASMSACVTSGGRLFYVVDEASRSDVRFPSVWFLVARDAFNGVVLWKRPIPRWIDQLRRFRSGPAGTAFRLAAEGDRVYVTLAVDGPVSILEAATGETLATCESTEHARQILRIDEKLVALVDTRPQGTMEEDSQIRRGLAPASGSRAIVAADASSGKTLWRKEIDAFVHPTLAAAGNRLFYQTNEEVFCLDLDSGSPRWRAAAELQLSGHEVGWESPTLVVGGAAVYCADFKRLTAFSVEDGTQLWQTASRAGYNSPPDVFLVGGLVWTNGKTLAGLDPATGEVKREIPTVRGYMHHRCYRNKATERFFLLGNLGVQFVDRESDEASLHHWIRGTCQYGVMPANGLLYVTPDSCACNMKTKLSGFWALSSEAEEESGARSGPRFQKGPAYGGTAAEPAVAEESSWPVYRHDAGRSGLTQATVTAALQPAWQAQIGSRPSGLTAASGRVFVASIDTHTVHALDQQSGSPLWTFTAGGRIDSPPTIHRGMALFGSADGWVYALRASDGELVWRFRAAPEDRRTFVNGQLESVWPVHGSLILHSGELVAAAGRSSYLDGGITVCRLDPQSGRLLGETVIYSPDPQTHKQPEADPAKDVRGLLSDILLADGRDVYMRQVKLDLQTGSDTGTGVHLFSPIGLLDDSWWHRGYWVFGDEFVSHWSGWWKAGGVVPSGRILSYDATSIFGYGRDQYPKGNTGQWRGGERYRLFACDRPVAGGAPESIESILAATKRTGKGRRAKDPEPGLKEYRWERQVPMHVRAMVVAGETMFLAGPPETARPAGVGEEALVLENPAETVAAWDGLRGGLLWAVSTADGEKLTEVELDAPPVFDGMAAAGGRLYLATTDGRVLCYAK